MQKPVYDGLYPVYVYEQGVELPAEGSYYVIAGNGVWMHKDTGIVKAIFPVENVSFLDDYNEGISLSCKLPKLPITHVHRIKEFFRLVVQKHRAESEINLYFNPKTNDFKIPEQRVSHSSVRYQRVGMAHLEGFEDYLRVGTIHSHCDFGAFHSGTDVDDEADFDGLHVTFGHNDKDAFTISASIVVNGYREKIDPLIALEGIKHEVGEVYTLLPVNDKFQILEGVSDWLKMVNSESVDENSFVDSNFPQVVWEEGQGGKLRDMMGEGPFEVMNYSNGRFVIQTTTGRACIPEEMLKRIEK